MTFSADGLMLIGTRVSGIIQLWDISSGGERVVLREARGASFSGFSPEGRFVAASGDDHIVRVWDLGAGSQQRGWDERFEPLTTNLSGASPSASFPRRPSKLLRSCPRP